METAPKGVLDAPPFLYENKNKPESMVYKLTQNKE
jgi:hypothetical protein